MIINSIVIPAHNEYENLLELLKKIEKEFSFEINQKQIEVIIVNDGSTDNTKAKLLNEIKNNKASVKIIHLIQNKGKHFALEIAFNYTMGKNIIIMDADQQYNVEDIKKLINKLDEGYDLVNGKRKNRNDDKLTIITSKFYNKLIKIFLRIKCEDFFSGLKIFKKEIIKVNNYRDLCRFIIVLADNNNFRITEIDISHNKRSFGKSKYNFLSRVRLSINDIITIFFLKLINKYKIYLLNIYSRFALVFTLIYQILSGFFKDDFNLSFLLENKLVLSLILLNIVSITLSSILDIYENHHRKSFEDRKKNLDYIEENE